VCIRCFNKFSSKFWNWSKDIKHINLLTKRHDVTSSRLRTNECPPTMQVLWNESIFLLLFSKWQCFKYLQCNSQWILWLNHVEDLILHVGKGHWFLTMQLHHFLNTNHTVKVPSKHFAMFIDRSTRRRHILSDVTRGGKGEHLPPGAALWGRQIEVGMLRTNYKMSNVSGCW